MKSKATTTGGIELRRIDETAEKCRLVRASVPTHLKIEILKIFDADIQYGHITLKDVYVYLVACALDMIDTQKVSLQELQERKSLPIASGKEANISVPLALSVKIDEVKDMLGINKKQAFIALLDAGIKNKIHAAEMVHG